MTIQVIGVMALFVCNCVLLFWNMVLRSKNMELSDELRKQREWHQRSLDRYKERI